MPTLLLIAIELSCIGQQSKADNDRLLISTYRAHAVEFRDTEIEKINKRLRSPGFRKNRRSTYYQNWAKQMKQRLEELQSKEAPKLFFGQNIGYASIHNHPLDIGMMGRLRAVDIVQIKNTAEMLVLCDDVYLWIQGLSNAGLTDGVRVAIPDLMLVSERKTYPTVMGGTRTLLVLEPFDIRPYLPKYGQAAKGSAFIASRRTEKFHTQSCRIAAKISDRDRVGFDTGIDARFFGYSRCRACSP